MNRLSKTIQVVSEVTGVCEENIFARSKFQEFVDARYMVVLLAREEGYSYSSIGRRMDDRDHSAITNLYQRGSNVEHPVFLRRLNQCRVMLMNRPISPDLMTKVEVCIQNTCDMMEQLQQQLDQLTVIKEEISG